MNIYFLRPYTYSNDYYWFYSIQPKHVEPAKENRHEQNTRYLVKLKSWIAVKLNDKSNRLFMRIPDN